MRDAAEYHLRRNRALNPHHFDMVHRCWEAGMKAAAKVRFPVARDGVGRFLQERNDV